MGCAGLGLAAVAAPGVRGGRWPEGYGGSPAARAPQPASAATPATLAAPSHSSAWDDHEPDVVRLRRDPGLPPKGDAEGRQNLHHLHSTASSSSTYINLILCARGAHDASQGFVLGPKRFSVGTDNFHEIDSFGLPCRSGSGKD
ncbi:hypothetical protein GCM10012280_71380 [Wenjunlia tyrosinilytica]|uniref:Uncharacterized protein n=1 Tax=Wenjunlia tyrosinilytica TaxID=1544741 RepID=A0A918A010_9ACTN|nr:hypothetical protein GCM10012280_71380 [Wenjunlia tyrosinilytica]